MVRLWYTVKYLNDGKNQQLILENPSHLTSKQMKQIAWRESKANLGRYRHCK